MTTALQQLIDIATPSPIGDDRFKGVGSVDDGVDATFGGHLLGQAVSAATATVDAGMRIHSFHAYFLRAGRPGQPFSLEVERVRTGRRFAARRVRVEQDEGRTQLEMMASFTAATTGPAHQGLDAPDDLHSVPRPDELPRYGDLMAGLDPLPLPEAWARRDYGLDLRTVNAPWAPAGPSPHGGIRLWIRADGELPADPGLHASLLAYQSDESLADNVAIPWGATWGSPGVEFVSLDHAMWFHRPVDLTDWLLLDQRPVVVTEGRGTARAEVWTASGTLVASIVQEALFHIDEQEEH
ncbi:MAG: acyl-CoA thioesterase domain-containing protein [Actinomycetota bacterium]